MNYTYMRMSSLLYLNKLLKMSIQNKIIISSTMALALTSLNREILLNLRRFNYILMLYNNFVVLVNIRELLCSLV
jgi:hypothetical protein